jgi:hypothetical protein
MVGLTSHTELTMSCHTPLSSRAGRVLAGGAAAVFLLSGAPVSTAARAAVPSGPVLDPSHAGAVPSSERGAAVAAAPRAQTAQDELRFVYFRDDRTTTVSGSEGDMSRAKRHRRSGEPMLWFRRDGREYVVRDPGVLRELDELWEPVSRIGAEQGRIGAEQGAIGAEQGRHGARQGMLGARQGVIGARRGVIAARLGLLAAQEREGLSADERREASREREAANREMRELDREMERLGDEMRQVAPPRELGDEMAALGRQMSALGRRMDEASRRAQAGTRRLVDRAISDGSAEAVR